MEVKFHKLPKKRIWYAIPDEVDRTIRDQSAAKKRTRSACATEALCRGLGLDPAEFGLAPATEGEAR